MKRNVTTYCKCGCGEGFVVNFYLVGDSGCVFVNTATPGFTAEQRGIWDTVKKRIKAAWFMLRGKEYVLHDIILYKDDWKDFLKTLNEFDKDNECNE